MRSTYKRILLFIIIAAVAVMALSACSKPDAGSSTNTQEKGVDEGDIVKLGENGLIYSLQTDGITVTSPNGNAPFIVDYFTPEDLGHNNYAQSFIPLELYVSDSVMIAVTGITKEYYAGDYTDLRSSDYYALEVTVFNTYYHTADEQPSQQVNKRLHNNIIYSFSTYGRLKESRYMNGQLYLFAEYEDVSTPDMDEYGELTKYSKRRRKTFKTTDEIYVDNVRGISYNSTSRSYPQGYGEITSAQIVNPYYDAPRSDIATGIYQINLTSAIENPATIRVSNATATYGSPLNTVYMSKNAILPIYDVIDENYYACGGLSRDYNLMITSYSQDLKFKNKIYQHGTMPSRYAFKEYDGVLFATIDTGGYVFINSYSLNNLTLLDSERLCYNEDLKAVNYEEDYQGARYCYAVTFRRVDPLYKADITNPYNITVKSELSITGYSVYLHKFPPLYTVGVGYEGDENGNITGAKVSLFDTRSTVTTEINSIVIPNVEHAEVFYDARAFCVCDGVIVFGFSLTRCRTHGEAEQYKQGFYLFGVKDGELIDVAYLSNFDGGVVGERRAFYDYSTYRKIIHRAVFVDTFVYTVADGMICCYDFNELVNGNNSPAAVVDTTVYNAQGGNATFPEEPRQDGFFYEGSN